MENIPYSSAIGSLMYAQVCTRPDIAFIVGMLGSYLSNPGIDHWKAAKRIMRYLQGTKAYMLTYRRSDQLEIIGYSDSDFAGCQDSRRSHIRLYLPVGWWSNFLEICQADTCSFIDYGSRVCSML